MVFKLGKQRKPALIETVDRLDRHGVLACPRNITDSRRRTDIDRQQIVGYVRARTAKHLPGIAVYADGLVAIEAGTGEFSKAAQINMNLIIAVVPGHVAGQHAGIRCVSVTTDKSEANTRHGIHGKALENPNVTV